MRINIPLIIFIKGNIDIFPDVLAVNTYSAFQLELDISITI